jgi:hypothetical protein
MDQREKSDGISRSGGDKRGKGIRGRPLEAGPLGASKLGEVVSEYITQQVEPRQSYFSAIAGVWGELIPAELQGHCALADFSKGRLKVIVDSPVCLYELQLHQDELLRQLRRRVREFQSGKVGEKTDTVQPLRQLKFTVGAV